MITSKVHPSHTINLPMSAQKASIIFLSNTNSMKPEEKRGGGQWTGTRTRYVPCLASDDTICGCYHSFCDLPWLYCGRLSPLVTHTLPMESLGRQCYLLRVCEGQPRIWLSRKDKWLTEFDGEKDSWSIWPKHSQRSWNNHRRKGNAIHWYVHLSFPHPYHTVWQYIRLVN